MACPHQNMFSCEECIKEDIRKSYVPNTPDIYERFRESERRVRELEREVKYLRQFGNRDCTAMADEAMENDNYRLTIK